MAQSTAKTPATAAPVVFELTEREEKKHVVLFKAPEGVPASASQAMTSAYVSRAVAWVGTAKGVRITIEPLG